MTKWIIRIAGIIAFLLAFWLGLVGITGIFLGMLMFISTMFLLDKAPQIIKSFLIKHAFISDIALTSLVTWAVSGLFGTGLTLGIAAVACGIFLSIGLKLMQKEIPVQENVYYIPALVN